MPVESDGTGLSSIRASLFPETVLVSFTFRDTLGSAKAYINTRGPISSIRIDKSGSGQGAVYLDSSSKGQKIELKRGNRQLAGTFDVGDSYRVNCKGKGKLECQEQKE